MLGRFYHLRADNKAACKDWVITLNRIKEAHLEQGNVKLVPTSGMGMGSIAPNANNAPVDLLDVQESHDFVAPRVVVVANRQRTRAVAESQDFDQIIRLREEAENPAAASEVYGTGPEKRLSAVSNVVLTRWTKRRSSLSRLSSKLRKWARSLRHYNCTTDVSAVGLDKHVHPPGHDDGRSRAARSSVQSKKSSSSAGGSVTDADADRWIAKEASMMSSVGAAARNSAAVQEAMASTASASSSTGIPVSDIQRPDRPRRQSSASEDIRVLS